MQAEQLQQCVEQLMQQANVQAGLVATTTTSASNTNTALQISKQFQLPVWWVDTNTSDIVLEVADRITGKGIIAGEYIKPALATKLRTKGIPYMDTAGNAFISGHGFHIAISGKQPARKKSSADSSPISGRTGKAFQAAGLKVIYALLKNTELANVSMRKLASAADVSLGSVSAIYNDLIAHRYLQQTSAGTHLFERDQLARRWAELYPYTIRKRLLIDRFTSDAENWWKNIPAGKGVQLGGEVAAHELSHYLTPKDGLVYVHKSALPGLMKNAQLRKIKQGEAVTKSVEIYEAFWKMDEKDQRTAPELIVYSDLLATADPRCMDAAERLWNEYIG